MRLASCNSQSISGAANSTYGPMAHESSTPTSSAQGTPPPSYDQLSCEAETEDAEDTLSSQSCKPLIPRPPQPATRASKSASSPFPLSWNLYHRLLLGRVLNLGPHERQPLFAVSQHVGWWAAQPDLVLHRGPGANLPPLAAGMGGVGLGRHSVIYLPPLPGSGLDFSQEFLLRIESTSAKTDGPPHARFRFTVEVGASPNAWRRETFEWRHTYGEAVSDSLDGALSGWKLVRLPDPVTDLWRCIIRGPRSSDEYEVVAVWAYARLSMTKVLRFRFLGSGAAGVLGTRWAIMAVMTALRMYQRQQQERNRDGAW
ncbi:hypothetical protein GGS26DRAFT_558220 [Hypomontagnella submonticulosa]|nr:hypothetical protein GGS26DRAFT_558220 [Hypomontagnella submonticulosa]